MRNAVLFSLAAVLAVGTAANAEIMTINEEYRAGQYVVTAESGPDTFGIASISGILHGGTESVAPGLWLYESMGQIEVTPYGGLGCDYRVSVDMPFGSFATTKTDLLTCTAWPIWMSGFWPDPDWRMEVWSVSGEKVPAELKGNITFYIPEPATLSLLAMGVLGLGRKHRR